MPFIKGKSGNPEEKNLDRRKKGKKLSPLEIAFLKKMAAGRTAAEAARLVFPNSTRLSRQKAHEIKRRIQKKMPEVMDRYGLSEKYLIEKVLKPALEAEETKFFQKDGVVTETRNVIAWVPRLTALDMSFRLRNSYPKEESSLPILNKITVVIQDVSRADHRTLTAEAVGTQ